MRHQNDKKGLQARRLIGVKRHRKPQHQIAQRFERILGTNSPQCKDDRVETAARCSI